MSKYSYEEKLEAVLRVVDDGMPRSTFYYNLKRMKKPDKYLKEKELIKAVFVENKRRYGYRRITMELRN